MRAVITALGGKESAKLGWLTLVVVLEVLGGGGRVNKMPGAR